MAKFKETIYVEALSRGEGDERIWTVIQDGAEPFQLSEKEFRDRYQPASNEAREKLGLEPVRRKSAASSEDGEGQQPLPDMTAGVDPAGAGESEVTTFPSPV